jgi:uncharacterized protein (DUF433 family)
MPLQDLQPQLLALSPPEKHQAIEILLQSLDDRCRGIDKTAGVCGGDARIMNTRIPVWVIVQARNLGNTDEQILENYPTLNAIDLSNVWAYAATYPNEITQAIQENEDA